MLIGYTKIYENDKTPYIIIITFESYKCCVDKIFNSDFALYNISQFTIIKIEDICSNIFDKINNYEVNKSYSQNINCWFNRNLAFNYKFIENKEYLFFKEGYSGIYKEYYYDGKLKTDYYHNNGIINGNVNFYVNNMFIQTFYIDGRLHGTKKIYQNHILIYECIYYNDINIGEEKTYYDSGEIKEIKNHDNNTNIKFWKNGKIRKNYFKHDRDYCPRYFCTCEHKQLNHNSPWLVLELRERNYSKFNEFMCNIIRLFTHQETEKEIKNKNRKRRDRTNELRKKYCLIELIDDD